MPEIWSPDDFAKHLLIWAGAPTLIICAFMTLLTLLGWKSFTLEAARHGAIAVGTVRNTVTYWTTSRQRNFVLLIIASATFTVVAYVVAQLIGFVCWGMSGPEAFMRAQTVDWHLVLREGLDYSRWNVASEWTLIITIASIFLLNIAHLAGLEALRKLIVGCWSIVIGLSLVAAAYIGFAAIALGLGIAIDMHNTPKWLLVLEVSAVVCVVALWKLAEVIRRSSAAVYATSVQIRP